MKKSALGSTVRVLQNTAARHNLEVAPSEVPFETRLQAFLDRLDIQLPLEVRRKAKKLAKE